MRLPPDVGHAGINGLIKLAKVTATDFESVGSLVKDTVSTEEKLTER
jgi:hypothetical protein